MNNNYPSFIRKFSALLFTTLCLITTSRAQQTLYNENFGTDTVFPVGWKITSGTNFSVNNAVSSTGYTGASGGSNMLFINSSGSGYQELVYDNNLSTVGYKIISVIWGGRRANTFSPAVKFEWSVDGVNWDSLPFTKVPASATWQIDNSGGRFFLPPTATNRSNLRFRFSFTATGSESGSSYRVDDFVVQGINDLYYEHFGADTVMPVGWTVTSGTNISINKTVMSNSYNGFSGGSNLLMINSSGSGLQEVVYDNNLSTVGYKNITVLWGARKANSFSPVIAFEWSSDGTTWNAVPFNPVASTATWSFDNDTVRLALPAAAEEQANLRFRYSFTATGTQSGSSYRIDDFSVRGELATKVNTIINPSQTFMVYAISRNSFNVHIEFSVPTTFYLSVVNSIGQIIVQKQLNESTFFDDVIHLPVTSSGIYYFYLTSEQGITARKIMLQ